jgi:hypothetical protein
MIFGHNTNVSVGALKYHVQTEDAGAATGLIDTTVYFAGRVLHRRTNNYLDLLPLNPDRENALKIRLDEQHRQVLEEIRSGALYLPPPVQSATPPAKADHPAAKSAQFVTNTATQALTLQLVNAKSWLAGKHATLHLRVSDCSGHPVSGAKITASVFGSAQPENFRAQTNPNGEAHLAFDMPRLTDPNAALQIDAAHAQSTGQLRFQLRAKQRVPVA